MRGGDESESERDGERERERERDDGLARGLTAIKN